MPRPTSISIQEGIEGSQDNKVRKIMEEVMNRRRTFHKLGETPTGEAFFSVSAKLGNGLVVRVWKTAML